jgi:phosphatidylinositol alpha-1,6-mannosyltransferase
MKEEPNIVYFIIGQGPEKEKLISLANKLNLKDKVAFIDYVSDADLANYFNICDIFLLMSKTIEEKSAIEGFGNVYLEASFMGKPVIGGKSGGTSDAVVDGKTGFLIEPDDAEELKKKIILLLKNKTLREKMGRYGRKRVLNGFLWKHNVEKLVKVYSGLLN